MNKFTVNADALYSAEAEHYFTTVDRRYMTGLRATLRWLGLPLPDYALCRTPGRRPAEAAIAAYYSDNFNQRPPVGVLPRRANATPEVIAAARAKSNRNQ